MAEQCLVLPDDVMEDIFARLPAKSVLRCRCLSHAWATRLSTDDFADRHLRLANRHGVPRILLLQHSASHGQMMNMWSPDKASGATLMDNVPRDLTHDRFPYNPSTFGRTRIDQDRDFPRLVTQQCRGLVILQAATAGMHYLCNPSTGQMTVLPDGRSTGCRSLMESYKRYACLGLGYDVRTRKHKVVRVYYRGCGPDKLPLSAGCEVYVVNTTELWRPVERSRQEKPLGWVNQNMTSVFAQGHVHWLAQRKVYSQLEAKPTVPQEMLIVSFSLADETFGAILPPLGIEKEGLLKHHLTNLGGRLCLLYNMWPQYLDVYLLQGHNTSTWDLHCRIDLATNSLKISIQISPLAILDGCRILLVQPRLPSARTTGFKLFPYNPMTGDIENPLDSSGVVTHQSIVLRHATLYEESMAFPGKQYKDIIFAVSLVLRRVPTYALMRLKLVCRSWRTMIESRQFDVSVSTCEKFEDY
ncbi:hypothetical protein CFC21_040862 [Triticum aestivum]|uniref:F-box domain-containing protein n=2 Tax=Triticum aestivum TaxID=4565 RepID=A0A3B6FNF4_WHEAT|nr:hypothetical protein CFC21_040862 [Triticum aestivum]